METFEEFYEMEGKIKRYSIDEYYYQSILSLVSKRQIKNVLDAGCGDAHICNFFENVIGMDISKNRILHASTEYPDCKFLQGSIYNSPFKRNSFDLVTAIEVIEHLEDPLAAIMELKRVSKEYILIQVPYNEIIKEEICTNCLKPIYPRGHLQSFDEKRLQSICEEIGVEILEMDLFFHAFDHKLIRWIPRLVLKKIKKWVFRDLIKHGGYIGILCKK